MVTLPAETSVEDIHQVIDTVHILSFDNLSNRIPVPSAHPRRDRLQKYVKPLAAQWLIPRQREVGIIASAPAIIRIPTRTRAKIGRLIKSRYVRLPIAPFSPQESIGSGFHLDVRSRFCAADDDLTGFNPFADAAIYRQ